MMKNMLMILQVLIFLTGCAQKPNIRQSANIPAIEQTIERAKNGIVSANDSVSTLLGLSLYANKDYNKLKVDSLNLSTGKYFTILVEYPNPVNNKFGIYDDTLKTLLVDRSLYGELSEDIITIDSNKYINVNEGFSVKDIYELGRISLYKIGNDKADLIFRTFTRLKEPGEVYTQKITGFSGSRIITKINSTDENFNDKTDIFEFDQNSGSYKSKQNLFADFVKNELHKLPQAGNFKENSDLNE